MFRNPLDSQRQVKLCIGVAGDRLVKLDSKLVIAGSIIVELRPGQGGIFEGTYAVPEGKVFVYGENSRRSVDSRDYGFVEISSIEGKIFYFRGKRGR